MTALEETFLKLPYSLLYRALSLGLSGCEWDVLLLLVRFSYGFHTDDCAASLTRLSKHCSHSRRQIGRALQRLQTMELIELRNEPTYRKAGQYTILEQQQCGADATVAQTPQAHARHTEETESDLKSDADRDISATPSGVHATPEWHGRHSEVTPAPHPPPKNGAYPSAATALAGSPNFHKDTLLKKLFKETGNKDMSVAFSNSTASSFSEKTDVVERLTKWFNEELGLAANLTKTEMREFAHLLEQCNPRLFQSAFSKFVCDCKGKPIPEHLQRPGDLCMMLARAAAHKTNRGRS